MGKGWFLILVVFIPFRVYAQGFFPPTSVYQVKEVFVSSYWHLERIQAEEAQQFACGKDVWVVLIDTGVDVDHPALSGQLLLALARNFGDEGEESVNDLNGHGTMMAGLILQVAPCAKLIPLKINRGGENSFGNEALSAALDYTLQLVEEYQEIKVVNLSLVMDTPDDEIAQKIYALYEKGVLVVAAAGNEGKAEVDFPASLKETIAVSSTDMNDMLARGVNYGYTLTLVAPGVDVYAPFLGGIYVYASGTSVATALVSGAAALVAEIALEDAGITFWALLSGSEDLEEIGHDEKTGFGRINVAKAVSWAKGRDIYVLPLALLLTVGERRPVYFVPQEAVLTAITAPVTVVEEADGYLEIKGEAVGEGYLELCQQHQCRRLNITVMPAESTAARAEVFFYPHKVSKAVDEQVNGFYDLQVEGEQQAAIDFWISYWSENGFLKELSHWEDVVLERGFGWDWLFLPVVVTDLEEGVYEMGVRLGEAQRDFLVVWPR